MSTTEIQLHFRKGDHVKIAPWTDAFMQGFTSGTVSSVFGNKVYVRWTMRPTIRRAFCVNDLSLISGVRP